MDPSLPSQAVAKELHCNIAAVVGKRSRSRIWHGCQKLIKTTKTNWGEGCAYDRVHQSNQVELVLIMCVRPNSPQRFLYLSTSSGLI